MLTRNFTFKEFACRCGNCEFSSGEDIDRVFVEKLQQVRDFVEQPMVITSALRCTRWNREVGGSVRSMHLKGLACDISCNHPISRLKILQGALDVGLTVGVYKTFLHLDNREIQICFVGDK